MISAQTKINKNTLARRFCLNAGLGCFFAGLLTETYNACSMMYNKCHMGVSEMESKAEKISEAEAEIMKVVWAQKEPMTYAEIRRALGEQKGWESPMVNTLVSRLVKKGILMQEKREVYYYTAAVSEEAYTAYKTKSFVQKVYGGNVKGLLSALVTYGDVTERDLDELRAFWENGGERGE